MAAASSDFEARDVTTLPAELQLDQVESLAVTIVSNFADEYVVLVLQPWQGARRARPPGILEPLFLDDGSVTLPDEAFEVLRGKVALLVLCVFASEEEEDVMQQLVPQVLARSAVFLIAVQILLETGKEFTKMHIERNRRTVACNPDNVVFARPDESPKRLRSRVRAACSVASLHAQRAELTYQQAPRPDPQEIAQMESQLHDILWNHIQRLLMGNIPRVNPDIEDIPGQRVGSFKLGRIISNRNVNIYEARRSGSETIYAMKVIDKMRVMSPGELEGIERELVILSDVVQHPHIVRCLSCIHTKHHVCLVLEYGGPSNLKQYLETLSNRRLETERSLEVFGQLTDAVGYLHEVRVSHRDLGLHHLVVTATGTGRLYCKLVDFRSALIDQDQATSTSKLRCGVLPYVAPEVLLGEVYVPRYADRWSVGICLLEMAGGLGCTERTVRWGSDDREAASLLRVFFGPKQGHSQALTAFTHSHHPQILQHVQALVRPEPRERAQVVRTSPV